MVAAVPRFRDGNGRPEGDEFLLRDSAFGPSCQVERGLPRTVADIEFHTGMRQCPDRVAPGAPGGEEVKRSSPRPVTHVGIGTCLEQYAYLRAVAVVGIVVQERTVAGTFVDVPTVLDEQGGGFAHGGRGHEFYRATVGFRSASK